MERLDAWLSVAPRRRRARLVLTAVTFLVVTFLWEPAVRAAWRHTHIQPGPFAHWDMPTTRSIREMQGNAVRHDLATPRQATAVILLIGRALGAHSGRPAGARRERNSLTEFPVIGGAP